MQKTKRLHRWEWWLLVCLLLGAWALRVIHFHEAPPGTIHDEVRNWLNVQLIFQGDIRALYPYGGGREAFYLFLQAASYKLFGTHLIAARFPSLMFSMFGIAISYSLGRRLFGSGAGLAAAAGFATSFWALMFARLAVRTGSMPVMALITTYAYLRLLQKKQPSIWHYGLAGTLLALTMYTYPSALIYPAVLVCWLLVANLLQPDRRWHKWLPFLGSFALALILCVPLIRAWTNPESTARADAVNAPLEALLAGDPGPTLDNITPVLGLFTVRGDVGLEFNVQYQPIFPTLLMKVLFLAGGLWSIGGLVWDKKYRVGYLLLLIWTLGMLVPTLVTEDPVNPSRTIGLLGIVYFFPAVFAVRAYLLIPDSSLRIALAAIVTGALLTQTTNTIRGYFKVWNTNPVIEFLYQKEYREVANYLEQNYDGPEVTVGGLTPAQLDPSTMILYMENDQLATGVGYFDPQSSLLIPPNSGTGSCVILPQFMTLHPELQSHLGKWNSEEVGEEFCITFPSDTTNMIAEGELNVSFGDVATLEQVDVPEQLNPGQSFTVLTYWQTEIASLTPLRIFLHLTDQHGNIIAQSDILGAPAEQWRQGDLLLQAHDLTLPSDAPTSSYGFNIGLYNPDTGERLPASSGGDFFHLEQ